LLNGVPYQSGHESTRKSRRWKWLAPTTLALAMAVMLPSRAHAGIFDIFGELFGTIQNDMGAALSQINALTQEMQQLHQQIVWPLALVNQARGFVSNSINSYRGFMTQVFTLKSPSATLASPQQLETILHSRQSAQIPALQASFAANYGTVPAVNAASPQDRVMMDIDDALGPAELEDDTHR
jgi:hypothetical protein